MRKYILIALLLAPLAANAQSAQQEGAPNAAVQALGQTLTETLSSEVQWRARAIADEQQISALQKKVGELSRPPRDRH
jgi:TolA-binding protein